MLPKETIRSGASRICPECGSVVSSFKVCQSGSGYYIGTTCPECGPYSGESNYYRTREEAQQALDDNKVAWRDL